MNSPIGLSLAFTVRLDKVILIYCAKVKLYVEKNNAFKKMLFCFKTKLSSLYLLPYKPENMGVGVSLMPKLLKKYIFYKYFFIKHDFYNVYLKYELVQNRLCEKHF